MTVRAVERNLLARGEVGITIILVAATLWYPDKIPALP